MKKALVLCAVLAVFAVSTVRGSVVLGTQASYQMDSTFADSAWGEARPAVVNSSSGPGSELYLGGYGAGFGASQYVPTVVGGGVSGNALSFNGVANQALANVWPTAAGTYPDGHSTGFTIDVWFNPVNALATQTVAQTSSFLLKVSGASLFFLVGSNDDRPYVGAASWGLWDVHSNEWNHFVGTVLNGSITGTLTNNTINQSATVALTGSIAPATSWMWVGSNYYGETGFFNGKIDNVQLTFTPEPATMVLLGLGGLLLARKKK